MDKISKNTSIGGGKKVYESPEINVLKIELEHSIAAGSAITNPQNLEGEILEEWQEDPDDNRTINW